jgi:hypothetical protein
MVVLKSAAIVNFFSFDVVVALLACWCVSVLIKVFVYVF